MTDRDKLKNGVARRLMVIFKASRDGYKMPDIEHHRLAGFIRAGVFLGLTTNTEMQVLMGVVHQSVFGMTIEQRKESKGIRWISEGNNCSQYDSPTFARKTD